MADTLSEPDEQFHETDLQISVPNIINTPPNLTESQDVDLLPINDTIQLNLGNDDIPVGKKNQINMDEYPDESQINKVIKKKKNPQSKNLPLKKFDIDENSSSRPLQFLDEVPVGGGQKLLISEYPEDELPPLEGFEEPSQIPLQQRLKSKVWKQRQTAFEEIIQIFQEVNTEEAVFDDYYDEWSKLLNDSNPGSQEKALIAFQLFLQKCNKKTLQQRLDSNELIKVLVDKCISPGKPQIKKLSLVVLCDLFQKKDKHEIYDALKQLLNNKNSKIICATLESIIDLLTNLGPKPLDYLKPFFSDVEKLSASSASSIRIECMNFYKEAQKWLGEQVLAPFTKNLKKAQFDELEKFRQEYIPQQMNPLRGGESVEVIAVGGVGVQILDAYDIVDAVDIFVRFNEKWCDKVIALSKWNEKVLLLEELNKAAGVPKLQPSINFAPYLAFIKKILNDPHQQVNICTIKFICLLVKGMRRNFHGPAKVLFPLVMMKLREKKTQMIDETKATLDQFFYSIGVEDVLDDLKEGLNDKTPQMKVHILSFIAKNLESRQQMQYNKQKNQDATKQLTLLIKKLLEDSVPEVREAALTCLGQIKPYLSDSALQCLSDINQSKLQRVNEIAQSKKDKTDEISFLSNQNSLRVNQNQQIQPSYSKEQFTSLKDQQVKQEQNQKKPPIAQQLQKPSATQSHKIELEQEVSQDEAESQLRKIGMPEEFFQNIDGNVKDKVQAIQDLQDNTDIILTNFDLILIFLKGKTKDWKDSNLQLNKQLFGFLEFVDSLDPKPFTKRSFIPLSKFLVEKMSDAKFKEDISKLLESYCSCVPPQFLVLQLISQTLSREDKKAEKMINVPPKTVAEIMNHIAKIINLVTMKFIPLKEMIDFCKENLSQTNSTIKQATVELLKTIYKFLGQDLMNFLNDLPQQTQKTLNGEFEKITVLSMNERGEAACLGISSNQIISSVDQIPRSDISLQAVSILKKLSDVQWQKKKEGLEELDKTLNSSGNRVQMTGLNELIAQLRQILSDKTKTIVRPLVNIVGKLAEACGKDFKIQGKQLIGPMISILSDKQVLVRQDVSLALERISNAIGSEQVIQIFSQYLSLESPELKTELLTFIHKNLEGFSRTDVKFFVQPLLNCLSDRAKEIRMMAEQILQTAIDCIGIEPFTMAMKDLKPALTQVIKPIIAKYGICETEDNSKKRNNKTPKGKGLGITQPIDVNNKKLQRNLTSRDLNASLDNSNNGSLYESRQRTPGKSAPKKILPPDITQSTIKAVFLEGSLLATSVSVRELKIIRLNQHDAISNWQQETFVDSAVQEAIVDIRIYMKPELSNLMMSYDYRKIIQSLKLLTGICNESVQKLNMVEISDLIMKWVLMRIYGGCANELLFNSFNSFLSTFYSTLEKTGYNLNELELSLGIMLIREFIYQGILPEEKMITSFLKIGGPDKIVRLWIRLIQIDHAKIHKHIDSSRVEKQLFSFIKNFLINYFREESLMDLARLPQLQNYPDVIQELQRTYDLIAKRAGISQPDPTSIASLKINIPPIQQQRLSNPIANSPRTLQFKQLLNSLLSPQVATKIESLMQINDRISQCEQNNGQDSPQYLFVNHAQIICTCFHSLLTWSFMPGEQVPIQYKQFLLQALQKLYQLQPFVRVIPYEPLCTFTEDLMLRLLNEDEHKAQYEQGDQFVKQLNSTTLRILENTDPDMVYAILLDLLIKHRRKFQQQGGQTKVINLLVKCIIRITKMLEKNVYYIKIDLLLLKFHNYMIEFSSQPNFPVDDVGMKTIKTILSELVKYIGERIWDSYQIIQQSDITDQHLGQWIRMLLTSQQTNQIMSPKQRLSLAKNENDTDILKTLSDMLKRPEQYDQGVRLLLEMIAKNPNLNWQRYTIDCGKNVQTYIQQQIDRQNIKQYPLTNNNSMNQINSVAQEQISNDFEQRNQVLLKQRVSDQQQYRSMNQGVNSMIGGPQLKTPDYLMQRLNDMKNKVQSLVGTTNQPQNGRQNN